MKPQSSLKIKDFTPEPKVKSSVYLHQTISLIATLLVMILLGTSCKKSSDATTDTTTTTDPVVTDPGNSSNNMGLILNTTKAFQGYTLMAPKQYTASYLLNNDGRIVHQWSASTYPPGQ